MIGKQDQNTIFDTTGVVVLCQKWQARLNYSKKNHYGIFFVHTSCMVLDLLIVMFYELDMFACLTICQFFKNYSIIIFLFFFFFFTDAVGINTGTKRLTFYSEQLWAMCNLLWMSLYSSADFLLELPYQCCNYMY